MSKSACHWRWFDKTKPRPAWLLMDPKEIAKNPDSGARHRLDYYRRIWNQTPPWATRHGIRAIYQEAHDRRLRGESVEVDHIIPLKGDLVSGLHCEANLRVIDAKVNQFKGNRRYPGAPQMELFGGLQHEVREFQEELGVQSSVYA